MAASEKVNDYVTIAWLATRGASAISAFSSCTHRTLRRRKKVLRPDEISAHTQSHTHTCTYTASSGCASIIVIISILIHTVIS